VRFRLRALTSAAALPAAIAKLPSSAMALPGGATPFKLVVS
jgi:hypothetical protein